MEGFFTKKEARSESRPDGRSLTCVSCQRYAEQDDSCRMEFQGKGKKGIMNVFSSADAKSNARKKVFSNVEGQKLKEMYSKLGVDLEEDCYNGYAVKCGGGSPPTQFQVDCCRVHILAEIKRVKPKVIVLFGDIALGSIIGNAWQGQQLGGIHRWRGFCIPDQSLQTWVCPTYSLSWTLGGNNSPVIPILIEQDLAQAIEATNTEFRKYVEPEIIFLGDDLSPLTNIKEKIIAFDYETTGLKPYAKGHQIKCASVAVSSQKVYTFMLPRGKAKQPFIDLIQSRKIRKVAANMKYEDTWSKIRLGAKVGNWYFDTMLAAHILDNRKNITSLRFQTYVNFGVVGYDDTVSPYLKSGDKNANSINRIGELCKTKQGQRMLLTYCALDSIFEYRLHLLQKAKLTELQLWEPYHLFHHGILALARAERLGMRIDVEYLNQAIIDIDKKIERTEKKFMASSFYKKWAKSIGGRPDFNSNDQLAKYLYNTLGIKPKKLTTKGRGSTDSEALLLLNIPDLEILLQKSKLNTLKDTFLAGIEREQTDGILHPFFNLHTVRTYRSSSSNINFQNLPKRDDMQMRTIRQAISPRKGNQILEMDFSGMEVAIACCYHKDSNMVKYVSDSAKDMHGDMAKQIFKIKEFDKNLPSHDTLRKATKNSFIFPQFYGDYFVNNAKGFCNWLGLPETQWKGNEGIHLENGITISQHLKTNKIDGFKKFIDHLKGIESHFWKIRFKQYGKWKEDWYSQYLKTGWFRFLNGFICSGLMGKNDVTNYPVQGAAFHCLLWAFIEIDKELSKRGMQSRLIGQIHDAVVIDVYPPELKEVYKLVVEISTVKLLDHYKWINVPLSVDGEICPVDGNWSQKEKYKL